MMPGYDNRKIRTQLLVWWTIWAASLVWVSVLYVFFAYHKPLPRVTPENPLQGLVGVVPVFISIIIRWLVVPRSTDPRRGLVLFVFGLAMAETCGVLGVFLGGPYRDSLFALSVLGILQYMPFYAKQLFNPKGAGFIPNN